MLRGAWSQQASPGTQTARSPECVLWEKPKQDLGPGGEGCRIVRHLLSPPFAAVASCGLQDTAHSPRGEI